jgi:hypothetical protein
MRKNGESTISFRPQRIGTIIASLVCVCTSSLAAYWAFFDSSLELWVPLLLFASIGMTLGILVLVGGIAARIVVSETGITKHNWLGCQWDLAWGDIVKVTVDRTDIDNRVCVVIHLQPSALRPQSVSVWDNEVSSHGIDAFVFRLCDFGIRNGSSPLNDTKACMTEQHDLCLPKLPNE